MQAELEQTYPRLGTIYSLCSVYYPNIRQRSDVLNRRNFLKTGFYEGINHAYANPPRSTGQILHPEKYLLGEEPQIVNLPELAQALGDTWRQRDSGVLGEFLTSVYLGAFLTEDQAGSASQGWGG